MYNRIFGYLGILLISITTLIITSCEDKKDTTPPDVSIISPSNGATVNEIVTISCVSSDNEGVDKVELWVDGDSTGVTDDSEPYALDWNTTIYDDGSHTITVRAYDINENIKNSNPVTLIIDNTLSLPYSIDLSLITYTSTEMTIVWNRSNDADFEKYEILVSESESGEKVLIQKITEINDTSFVLSNFDDPSQPRWYFIQITDTFGYSSTGNGYYVLDSPPNSVQLYPIFFNDNSFSIYWSKCVNNDFGLYKLYESLSENMDGKTLIYEGDNVNDTSYVVIGIDQSEKRYYQVFVEDYWGLESLSNIEISNNFLISATFIKGFVSDTEYSYLIVHDEDGLLLADTSWIGEISFELYPEIKISKLEKVNITFVTKRFPGRFQIETNPGISVGKKWTWKLPNYPYVGSCTFNFINVPPTATEGYIISGGGGFKTENIIVSENESYSVLMFSLPIDILVGFNTSNGPLYKWVTGIDVGNNYTIDLSDAELGDSTTISFPEDYEAYSYGLYGINSDQTNERSFQYRFNWRGGPDKSQMTVHYPKTISRFYSWINTHDVVNGVSGTWSQVIYGDLPASFTKVSADLDVISSSIDGFKLNSSGIFDQFTLRFDDASKNRWYVFQNPQDEDGRLPEIWTSIKEHYPEIERSQFFMQSATAIDYLDVEGQAEWHQILFESEDYHYDLSSGYRSRIKYPN